MSGSPAQEPAVRVFGLLPAAGRSRRMGRPKQLITLDGKTMLSAVMDAVAGAGPTDVALVVHSELGVSAGDFGTTPVRLVVNDDPNSEMIDSIRMGLATLAEQHEWNPTDGILLCPADLPRVTDRDVILCAETFARRPNRLVIAAYRGRRGHPIVFPATLVPFVLSAACDCGLRALAARYADRIELVDCGHEGVLRDVDTPDDLSSIRDQKPG